MDAKLVAFYLPQFHPIPENDSWWGKGFTEWTNVTKARPLFPGHYQPHLPADLGFYDLRLPQARAAQADLARSHGIHGFCYYRYWFDGAEVLDAPFKAMLESGTPDFPFCICWANENWTRRWDGREDDVLLAQRHSDSDDRRFLETLLPALRDPRYIRIKGRPLILVYRSELHPDPARMAAIWREVAKKGGVGDVYLCRAETFLTYEAPRIDPKTIGFDAAVEFPPHGTLSAEISAWVGPANLPPGTRIYDYEQVVFNSMARPSPDYTLFRGVMPSWDNSARRAKEPIIYVNATPSLYQKWLSHSLLAAAQAPEPDERIVFINAWNEWGEACHLEPDTRFGHAWLEATRAALNLIKQSGSDQTLRAELSHALFEVQYHRQFLKELGTGRRLLAASDHPDPRLAQIRSAVPEAEALRQRLIGLENEVLALNDQIGQLKKVSENEVLALNDKIGQLKEVIAELEGRLADRDTHLAELFRQRDHLLEASVALRRALVRD